MLTGRRSVAGLASPSWPLDAELWDGQSLRPDQNNTVTPESAANAAEALVRPWLLVGTTPLSNATQTDYPQESLDASRRYQRSVQVAWDVAYAELRKEAQLHSRRNDHDFAATALFATAAAEAVVASGSLPQPVPPRVPASDSKAPTSRRDPTQEVTVHSSNETGVIFSCPKQLLEKPTGQTTELDFWITRSLEIADTDDVDDPEWVDDSGRFDSSKHVGLTSLPPLPPSAGQQLGALGTSANGSLLAQNQKDSELSSVVAPNGVIRPASNGSSTGGPPGRGTNIPSEWRSGSLGELAQRADSTTTSTNQGAFLLVEDPNECYTIWTQVWQQWRRENPSAPVVPGDGFGFLRHRRLQNWTQKQRYNHRKGNLSGEREKLLTKIGFFDEVNDGQVSRVPIDAKELCSPRGPNGLLVAVERKLSPKEKVVVSGEGVPAEIALAALKRPRGFHIPESWTAGEMTDQALQYDERKPSDSEPLALPLVEAINVYTSFKEANAAWAPLVPKDGFGFLKSGALYNWLTLQWERLESQELPVSDVEALAAAGIRRQSFREVVITDQEVEAAIAESQVVIPPEWLTGEVSDLARKAEAASRSGDTFRLSMDTSEAFRLWCKVLESFVRSNQALGPGRIPVNGYGFLRMRRMYDWVSKQRRKWVTGVISDEKRQMLQRSGFEPPLVDAKVAQQQQKSIEDRNLQANIPESWISGEYSDLAARAEKATISGEVFRTSSDPHTSFKLWCGILKSFITANPKWTGPVPGNGYGFLRSKRMYDWVCKQRKKCMDGLMPAEKLALLRESGFVVDCPDPVEGPVTKKQKIVEGSPLNERTRNLTAAETRAIDHEVTIPQSWKTGDLKDLAERAEDTAVKGEILKVAPDPANSFNIWCHIYRTFLEANPGREERVPGIGFGFLKNRRLYDWVKAQQRKIGQGDLPPSKAALLRSLGFKVPDDRVLVEQEYPVRTTRQSTAQRNDKRTLHRGPPENDVSDALSLPTSIVIPDCWISAGRIGELARSAEESLANRTMFRVDFATWCDIYKSFNNANPEWCQMGLVPRKGAGFLKGARLYEWLRNQRKLVATNSLPGTKRLMLEKCNFRAAPANISRSSNTGGANLPAGMKYKTTSLVAPEDISVPQSWLSGSLAVYAKKAEDSSRVRKQFKAFENEERMFELWVEILGSYIACNPNFERDGIPITGPGFLRSRRLHDFAKTQYKLWFKKELSAKREALLRGVGFTF